MLACITLTHLPPMLEWPKGSETRLWCIQAALRFSWYVSSSEGKQSLQTQKQKTKHTVGSFDRCCGLNTALSTHHSLQKHWRNSLLKPLLPAAMNIPLVGNGIFADKICNVPMRVDSNAMKGCLLTKPEPKHTDRCRHRKNHKDRCAVYQQACKYQGILETTKS